MINILNDFLISYDDYIIWLGENFKNVDTTSSIAFIGYILILILLFNILKFFFEAFIQIVKIFKSMGRRNRW